MQERGCHQRETAIKKVSNEQRVLLKAELQMKVSNDARAPRST